MYYVTKRMEISGSHYITLEKGSKCEHLHGHNWIVTVHCRSRKLNRAGMVVDFTHIKREIHDRLDHHCINDVVRGMNPTAENMARWICDLVPHCYKVEVQESEGNVATYEKV